MSITSLDHDAKVTATMDALKQKGCVLFVGAGISISPPAGLPNWHNLRDWTLEAVGNQDVNLQSYLPKLTELDMIGSPGRKGMTPELVASVISRVCPNYFDSLETRRRLQCYRSRSHCYDSTDSQGEQMRESTKTPDVPFRACQRLLDKLPRRVRT